MSSKKRIIHTGALLFILNGLFYLIGEFIAAIGTGYPLKEVYLRHFISSLGVYPYLIVEGVPNEFSKLAMIMNIDFIATGVGFFIAYYLLVFEKLKTRKFGFMFIITPLIFAVGSILVGVYQGGVPSEDGIHGLGARLSFLGGNFTVLISGIALFKQNKKYAAISILLGLIGLISASFMNNAINNSLSDVVAIYERMTVYPIMIWQLMTGFVFLNKGCILNSGYEKNWISN